jgi:hypothetical protein
VNGHTEKWFERKQTFPREEGPVHNLPTLQFGFTLLSFQESYGHFLNRKPMFPGNEQCLNHPLKTRLTRRINNCLGTFSRIDPEISRAVVNRSSQEYPANEVGNAADHSSLEIPSHHSPAFHVPTSLYEIRRVTCMKKLRNLIWVMRHISI